MGAQIVSEPLEGKVAIRIPEAVVPEEEAVRQWDLLHPLEHQLDDLIKLTKESLRE